MSGRDRKQGRSRRESHALTSEDREGIRDVVEGRPMPLLLRIGKGIRDEIGGRPMFLLY